MQLIRLLKRKNNYNLLKPAYILIFFLLFSKSSISQELNCTVQILSSQIQSSDKRVFKTLQSAIYEFMNNRKWTNEQFRTEERIECTILINITEWNIDEFKGTMQIQVRRPIYNSSYDSRLLNINDNDLEFRYLEYDPLEFSENTHINNLTSILAFYAYIIIGVDYDSFSSFGGSNYLLKAQGVVNNAQSAAQKRGWSSVYKKNKYWLSDDILNQIYKPYRECMYKYHRLGLDKMSEDVNSARIIITESLEGLEKIYLNQPSSFILQVFFDSKADEIINIYSGASRDEKARIVKLLNKINPANTTKYAKILKR